MATQQNGRPASKWESIDELVHRAVASETTPIGMSKLVDVLRRQGLDDDLEIRHSLWRLIDDGALVLNRERMIEERQHAEGAVAEHG